MHFQCIQSPLQRNVCTKQDSINKIYKFYKGTFTDFVSVVCLLACGCPHYQTRPIMTDPWDLSVVKSLKTAQFSLEVQQFNSGVVHDFYNFWKQYSQYVYIPEIAIKTHLIIAYEVLTCNQIIWNNKWSLKKVRSFTSFFHGKKGSFSYQRSQIKEFFLSFNCLGDILCSKFVLKGENCELPLVSCFRVLI